MCGADLLMGYVDDMPAGSPPHVRGGLPEVPLITVGLRFTPACAGRIFSSFLGYYGREVHPRMCGADLQDLKTSLRDGGSPPHVRGGCSVAGRKNASTGFTPACAGRMTSDSAYAALYRVHPRMCGADEYPPRQTATRMGSPPHVRGGSAHSPDKRFYRRFTPACAGRMEDACNAFFGI